MTAPAYAREVCRRVQAVAGARLVGAWLVGSAALGGFDPQRSDVDVQAVVGERLGRAELERLVRLLDHDALPCPFRGLEFVLYARADLDDPGGPAFLLNLNTGPRMARHVAFDPGEDPRFWFTLDVSIARQAGIALTGPPPADVFPELPRDLVAGAADEAVGWWAAHDASGREADLARRRADAWLADGRWRSKAEVAGAGNV